MRWRRWLDRWPIAVWAAVAVVAVAFYVKSTQFGVLSGSVVTIKQSLSPIETARVKTIFVKIGDGVTNGQLLAQMDTILVDSQLAEAEAALTAAEGSWAGYEQQMLGLLRSYDNDITSAEAALAQQQGHLDSDFAKLAELKAIQAKRDALFASKLINATDDDALRPEIAGLEKDVVSCRLIIQMDEAALASRKKELNMREQLIKEAIAQKTAAQTKILGTAVEMKKLQKESYSLRAQAEGVVSDIGLYPGSMAKPGDNVVSVVSASRSIIGYLPEVREGMIKVGDWGYGFRLRSPPVKVRVVAAAPEIDDIPTAVRPSTVAQQSSVTFRAQRIVLELDGPGSLLPGESVQIRLTSEFWAKLRYRLGLQW